LEEQLATGGREAGASLGANPVEFVAELARRTSELVEATDDGAALSTQPGTITLVGYLPTRALELTVHSLDLARALGVEVPDSLRPAVAASCRIAGCVAAELPNASDFLLLLTGRSDVPNGLSVI
jgi:hypothetical protein